MKIKWVLLIVLSLIVAVLTGCKKDDNPVNTDTVTGALMPLKIGNFWVFETTYYDTSGSIMGVDTTGFMVVRDTTINNEKWYFIGFDSTAKEMISNRSNGLWYARLASGTDSAIAPYLYAKYPASVNYSWLLSDSSKVKVMSIDTSLALPTIPDTNFRCYLYGHIEKGATRSLYFKFIAPGIGFVRDAAYDTTASGRMYLYGQRDLFGARFYKSSARQSNVLHYHHGSFLNWFDAVEKK
jgi:hypothetical protein